MEPFAKYGFNKSHSAAYAYIAYQTAYLKAYYTPEFLAANLKNEFGNVTGVLNISTNITERKIAEEEFREIVKIANGHKKTLSALAKH